MNWPRMMPFHETRERRLIDERGTPGPFVSVMVFSSVVPAYSSNADLRGGAVAWFARANTRMNASRPATSGTVPCTSGSPA